MAISSIFCLIGLQVLLIIVLWYRTKSLINPFTLMVIFFFLPMTISTLPIGRFQAGSWSPDTILLMVVSIFAWGLIPFFWLFVKGPVDASSALIGLRENITKLYIPTVYFIAILFLFLYFVENYLLVGYFLPILSGGVEAHEAHVKSLPIFGVLTRGGSMVCCLLAFSLLKKRSVFTVVLIGVVLLIPITRGSRLDIFFSVVSLAVIIQSLGIIRLRKWKSRVGAILVSVLLVILMTNVGSYRSQSLTEDYSYAGNLGFQGDNQLLEFAAVFYGNFSLPFVNLDRFVARNRGQYLFGQFSIMPFSATLINFPELSSLPDLGSLDDYSDPVSPNGVSTSLAYFYKDFGAVFAGLPMILYMILWLKLCGSRYKTGFRVLVYSIYSPAFCFSGFMAFILNPSIYRRFILIFIILSILGYMRKFGGVRKMGVKDSLFDTDLAST